jgi:hypothetical protein
MSATRKILLALSILSALLCALQVYDWTTSDFAESRARSREAYQTELRALEAGQPPPDGAALDERQREARISDLRAWTSHADEEAAMDREDVMRSWRNTILMFLLAGGLGAAFFLTGRKNGPRALVRLGQLRPGVILAVLAGLVAGTVLISFAGAVVEEHQELTRAEERFAELEARLKSFPFDADGNVAPDKRGEFESMMAQTRFAPDEVIGARERRNVAALIVLASTVVLGLSVYFGRRSWLRSAADPAAPAVSPRSP